MKRLMAGMLNVVAILAIAGIWVSSAPDAVAAEKVGLYEGTFRGVAYGDRGSRAPLELELTHRGDQVAGTVFLGEGLHVNGGFCGAVDLPALAQRVEGETLSRNPGRLMVSPTFDVGGFDLNIDFESDVSADSQVITAKAKGVRPVKLLFKYPVRLALNPFISGIGGLFPMLVSGGAIVAMVLSLPTVGPLMLYALMTEDMYLAGSMLMVLSLLGVFGTLVSDLLLLWLDPRIRFQGGSR